MSQVQANLVAIISLVVALVSLGYNTWRNEQTEHNRNIRHAGFEVLKEIGELQEIVFFGHYEEDETRGSPRAGWASVLVIGDLAGAMPDPVPERAAELHETWRAEWEGLGERDDSEAAISGSIDALRSSVLHTLQGLD